MKDIAIYLSNVYKKYKIYHDKAYTLKDKILFWKRNRFEERWILQDINLEILKGESVGIVGKNGSGKSTLLKLLTRIIYPNKGEIRLFGRVAAL